ncbi:nucleoid-associated protein [Streptomyces sp. NBC_01334]|uniref:nucleoid-associated protein n=1 Tax=Streptomyces sp. NBC_01334 TaxID=2903827 RepID=UPI002E10D700|nr:nucleoid-associated protein [Streptomyces sp. NBC_01334]
MRTDFGDLVVKQAIVHVVPKRIRGTELAPLELSQAVCQLDDTVRTALQARLRDVLTRLSREVVEDPDIKSGLPDAVRAFLTDEQDLVSVSGEIAYLLRDNQTASNPAGLLLVATARLDGQRALLMVKLEQETGMQAKEITADGLRTFDVQYFANLLFTERSKVYKVALFSEEGLTEERLEGWAADAQMSGKTVARFFLEKFLGCRHKNDPRELTRRFHDTAIDWVNTRFTDPEVRMDYVMAVMVELQSSAAALDPTAFIQKHVRPQHRDDFADFLEENDVPVRVFDKDNELVSNRLQKMRVELSSGAFLVAPVEAVQDGTVEVEDLGDGRTIVTVPGIVTRTSSFAGTGRHAQRKKELQKAQIPPQEPGCDSASNVPAADDGMPPARA